MIKRCLLLAGGLALQLCISSDQVFSADLLEPPGVSLKDSPAPFMPSWPGFYLGGHAGGVWGSTGVDDDVTYVGDPSFNGSLNSAGFIGGAQAGYNIQRSQFVFGLEGDIGYLGLTSSKSVGFTQNSCSRTYADGSTVNYTGSNAQTCDLTAIYSMSGGLYGDLTGRLGYTMGPALLYAKGGFAFADADFQAHYLGQSCKTIGACGSGGPSVFDFGQSSTLPGWTLGAGVEYALTALWSLKAEYQHFDFGSMSYSYSGCVVLNVGGAGPCPGGHYTSVLNGITHVAVTADTVTVGLNYHLN